MMSGSGEGFNYVSLIAFGLIFLVMYFLLIRPQQKRAREQQEMLKKITRGDRVLTSGGIIGTVSKVINPQELEVEVADGVKVRLMRSMVVNILTTLPTEESKSEQTPSLEKNKSKERKLSPQKTKKEKK